MRKEIAILATALAGFAGLFMIAAPANAASTCSNYGFATEMKKSSNYALQAMNSGMRYNFAGALRYVNRAQDIYVSAPYPCASLLKRAHSQYGISLDYTEVAMTAAVEGRIAEAVPTLRNGLTWLKKATASLKLYNSTH